MCFCKPISSSLPRKSFNRTSKEWSASAHARIEELQLDKIVKRYLGLFCRSSRPWFINYQEEPDDRPERFWSAFRRTDESALQAALMNRQHSAHANELAKSAALSFGSQNNQQTGFTFRDLLSELWALVRRTVWNPNFGCTIVDATRMSFGRPDQSKGSSTKKGLAACS